MNVHDIVKTIEHSNADKDCPLCKGAGSYPALHVGEYEEIRVSVKCSCTRRRDDERLY